MSIVNAALSREREELREYFFVLFLLFIIFLQTESWFSN